MLQQNKFDTLFAIKIRLKDMEMANSVLLIPVFQFAAKLLSYIFWSTHCMLSTALVWNELTFSTATLASCHKPGS